MNYELYLRSQALDRELLGSEVALGQRVEARLLERSPWMVEILSGDRDSERLSDERNSRDRE